LDSPSRSRRCLDLAVGLLSLATVGNTAYSQDRGTGPIAPSAAPTAVRLGTPMSDGAVPTLPVLPDPVPASGPATPGSAWNTQGFPLIAGQEVQPIDLANALRLAGARDLDIATARQQVLRAVGDLDEARGLWLPSLFTGPTYYRLDGQVQAINGQVMTVDRGSLFLGTTASLANSFPAAPPGSGFPPLNTLSGVLRISDAIFGVGIAKRTIAANRAGVGVATNNALLAAAEAYFDLQQAAGTLAIAREATGNAQALAEITESFVRSGAGLEADHRRILTELRSRRRAIRLAAGQLEVASANLVRPLLLDPHVVVAPAEPAETVYRLVADDCPLDDLIAQGWRCRPELAQARELVEAALLRLKQAKARPFVPSLAVTYSGGGFGGGTGSFFGNFSTRGDFAVSLFWELRGLGLSDRGAIRLARAGRQTADIDLIRVQAQVANDVVASYKARLAASEAMDDARESVAEALQSLELNLTNIRGGGGLPGATRPIEVLQPIQALAQARADYLLAVLSYNRAQFRLYRAVGQPPTISPPSAPTTGSHSLPASSEPNPSAR
jgi:outer membrane protein TolC